MAQRDRSWWRWGMPLLGVLVAIAQLAWEHSHGGVRSHHLLNRADLPAISNWWGLLSLPLVGWLAVSVVASRAAGDGAVFRNAVAGAVGAWAAGGSLSVAFVLGNESVAFGVLVTLLLCAVVVRAYRAEYLFGFVLGMTFVFGAVLPCIVFVAIASVSAIAHFALWPALRRLIGKTRRRQPRVQGGAVRD
ncbi:putative membrane protein YeaQ/YmgE (transglycosylase-associated protein family) [Xanthomonas arboricola]